MDKDSSVLRDTAILEDVIDLDMYDPGAFTLGYAERIPTYSYDSYIYKNTLRGNLDYFKIFRDVAYKLDKYNEFRSENITQNSKYVFDGITYHNRDNKKCKVNWLYQNPNHVEYRISDVSDVTVMYNYTFNNEMPHRDAIMEETDIKGNSVVEMGEEYTNSVFPILKFDLEKQIDASNVEF